MEEAQPTTITRTTLSVILIAATVQGWALYGLHHALEHKHWPAESSPWLLALYTLAILIPTTIQLLSEHVRKTAHWLCVFILAGGLFYFGWHHGSNVQGLTPKDPYHDTFSSFGLIVAILWLTILPFVQSRLISGRWAINYALLFSSAWRNKLMLAEAGLFTGLFWLLLFLWRELFHMLGIDYFRDLFSEPIFIYPITALAFGIALHLIGSIDRWTTIVLEQILNVLKWLAAIAGFILALFTCALLTKLPDVVFTGQRAIGASWLLWLVAVMVLFINAAYRDGTVERPYPKWLARPLQWATPLTIVVSLTALYALDVRTQRYGLTVERIWALIVAGMATIYAIGYSASALSRSGWLPSIARVNVIAAIALIVVMSASLTPLLSPFRLAAESQFRMAREYREEPATTSDKKRTEIVYSAASNKSPFAYLRFDAGQYGTDKLQQLAELQNHPQAEKIRALAKTAQAQKNWWTRDPEIDVTKVIDTLDIYPASRTLDSDLRRALLADLRNPSHSSVYPDKDVVGVFIDLNDDAIDEFVLQAASSGLVYQTKLGHWARVARTNTACCEVTLEELVSDLRAGNFNAQAPAWKNLSIGGRAYRMD